MDTRIGDEELRIRLESAKAAQERTRLAFFANTVIGLCLFALFWNAYASIYVDYVTGHYLPSYEKYIPKGYAPPGELPSASKDLPEWYTSSKNVQKELMQNWVSSRFITVSLLGLKFGAGDAPELGSLAVMVSLVWFLLVVQRENYTIGALLRDAWASGDEEVRWRVYHGIVSYTVFTDADATKTPISSLSGKNSNGRIIGRVMAFLESRPRLKGLVAPLGARSSGRMAASRQSPQRMSGIIIIVTRLRAQTSELAAVLVWLRDILWELCPSNRTARAFLVCLLHFFPIIVLILILVGDVGVTESWWNSPFRVPQDRSYYASELKPIIYWTASGLLIAINSLLFFRVWGVLSATGSVLRDYCAEVRRENPRPSNG